MFIFKMAQSQLKDGRGKAIFRQGRKYISHAAHHSIFVNHSILNIYILYNIHPGCVYPVHAPCSSAEYTRKKEWQKVAHTHESQTIRTQCAYRRILWTLDTLNNVTMTGMKETSTMRATRRTQYNRQPIKDKPKGLSGRRHEQWSAANEWH